MVWRRPTTDRSKVVVPFHQLKKQRPGKRRDYSIETEASKMVFKRSWAIFEYFEAHVKTQMPRNTAAATCHHEQQESARSRGMLHQACVEVLREALLLLQNCKMNPLARYTIGPLSLKTRRPRIEKEGTDGDRGLLPPASRRKKSHADPKRSRSRATKANLLYLERHARSWRFDGAVGGAAGGVAVNAEGRQTPFGEQLCSCLWTDGNRSE